MQAAAVGDKVALLVDLGGAAGSIYKNGSITVFKNGAKLGVVHTGADLLYRAELHWAVCLHHQGSVVVQPAATPPK